MTLTTAWSPLTLGETELSHRIVLAPMTRGRATISTSHPQTSVPNDLMIQYYSERATPGGLLISEASPVSLRASGFPGIPGFFTDEHLSGWTRVVEAIHAKGGKFFAQLWHQGRQTHSIATGQQPESSSATLLSGVIYWNTLPVIPYEIPKAMTQEEIWGTQDDYVKAALMAREAGCDGVELHAASGYLLDQFHHSNVNQRTDDYGGSSEKRCKFTLETVDKLCMAIGRGQVAIRLSPFGFFNDTFGEDRVPQWTYLCKELAKRNLAYVHMIEPRFDEFKSQAEKLSSLGGMDVSNDISLAPFRKALGSTPLLAAGGFGPDDYEQAIRDGQCDLVAFGRFFAANADLVDRLREEKPLYKWDRSRFYGPFEDNEVGYTVYPTREYASASDSLKAQLAV